MKFRERIIQLPKDVDDRLEGVLQAMKDRDDRIPKDLGITDFLAMVVVPQGIGFLETAVAVNDREKRIIKLPEEVQRTVIG